MLSPAASLPPGFRFYPTDEELIVHYLRNQAAAAPCPVAVISEVDIYKHNPWDLPDKAMFGDKEWYFFSPRDRKYPNGIRPNRAAASGYWKATGIDKPIYDSNGNGNIGVKKALVFYKGRPPKGKKTNWIMHEYRLANPQTSNIYKPMKFRDSSMRLDDWVLCRIYKKSSHQGDEEDADDGMASEEHKSSSISEFDNNLSELPGHGLVQGSSFPHPSLNQFLMVSSSSNGNSVQQLKQEESSYASVVVAEKSLKRQREHMNAEEEMNGVCTDHIITNMDGFQFQESWINQALSTQQLLLNSNYFGIN